MKAADVAVKAFQFAMLALGSFVVFKVGSKLKDALDNGKTVADSVVDAVKETVNEINPLNNNNVIARTLNDGLSSIAGRETSLGSLIYDAVDGVKSVFTPKEAVKEIPFKAVVFSHNNESAAESARLMRQAPAADESVSESSRLMRYQNNAQDTRDLSISNPVSRYTNNFDNMAM